MKLRVELLAGAAILVGASASLPAWAQDDQTLETVVVSGVRASLESAMNIKKNATTIVDSIVAEDIGKFPDLNVADSLQHITGVQITRDFGEGNGVAIRGLTQIETTLNGQEIMTASGSRTLNFEDLPAELVSGVDVYKTPTSNLLEGGLGGLVDVRTARPFDFSGLEVRANARVAYGDLIKAAKPQLSALISDRWTTSIGEIGVLFDASFQQRGLREDYDSAGATTANTYAISGSTVAAPNGFYNPMYTAHRDRLGLNGSLQWRPTSELDFYVDANFMRFSTYMNQYIYSTYPSFSTSVAGSFSTFPGTTDLAKGTYAGSIGITTSGVSRDSTDQVQNYVVGGTWNHDKLTISGNIQYVKGSSNLFYTDVDLATTASSVTFDLTTEVPSYRYTGVDLTNLSNYKTGALSYSVNYYNSDQVASKLDAAWQTKFGPITELDAGFRYAVHDNTFAPIRLSTSTGSQAATAVSSLLTLKTDLGWQGLVSGVTLPSTMWMADPNVLRANISTVRSVLGVTTVPSVNPISVYTQSERVTSGYMQAKFETELLVPISGTFGVRLINTNLAVLGNKTNVVNGVASGTTAINSHTSQIDVLPALNVTAHLSDDFKFRFSASKTMNRPSFSNLTPGLTLVPYNGSGSAGNPDLKAMYATSYDTSLEYYFNKSDSVYVAAFWKDVKNFVFSKSISETIDGVSYNITEPVNSGDGTVKGFEVGYTQFYDFLPGFLSGLGMQANFTYVDSQSPSSVSGYTVPLSGLSRYSYNLIGIYEKGPVTMRLAYNWRSKYFSSLYAASGVFAGYAPVYQDAFGWLDASVSYDLNDQLSLSLEGNNLLHTQLLQYYTVRDRPANVMVNDRQFIVGLRYKM